MTEQQGKLPPQSLEQEQAVLGALLLAADSSQFVATLTVDVGLRAEHFYFDRHKLIFEAMTWLTDHGDPVDVITVCGALDRNGALDRAGGKDGVYSLSNLVPSVANFRAYGARVLELARWRTMVTAGRQLMEAAYAENRDLAAEAEGILNARDDGGRVSLEAQREAIYRHLAADKLELIPWPWASLTEQTGGIWPGHLTVVIGPSKHGKSALADAVIELAARRGARCCKYLTEQTHLERNMRFIARQTGVPLRNLMLNTATQSEKGRAAKAIPDVNVLIKPAGTMTATDVARDIRRNRWDVALVDLLNVVTRKDVRDLDDDIAMLAGLANDTGCHIIGCNHLNRSRRTPSGYPEKPTEGDIRGSGAIHDLATNVLSIYRFEVKQGSLGTGAMSDDAVLDSIKFKNFTASPIPLTFDGNRMRFLEPAAPGTSEWRAA